MKNLREILREIVGEILLGSIYITAVGTKEPFSGKFSNSNIPTSITNFFLQLYLKFSILSKFID